MKYIARLSAAEWTNGSGWNCGSGFDVTGDTLEEWNIDKDDVDAWKEMIKDGDKSLFDYATDNLDDDCDEDPDDWEGDTKYTMQLIEIDEDDVFEEGKVIASTSIWLSELVTDDEDGDEDENGN